MVVIAVDFMRTLCSIAALAVRGEAVLTKGPGNLYPTSEDPCTVQ